MNIHLVNDEKFINKSFEVFEHYYPGENIFFVKNSSWTKGESRHVDFNDRIIEFSFWDPLILKKIKRSCSENSNLFVHMLDPLKAYIALQIQEEINIVIYWIFYGSDLYSLLNKKNKYQLYDYQFEQDKSTNKWTISTVGRALYYRMRFKTLDLDAKCYEFIKKADFFCFWNHHDFELLKKHFDTNLKYKYFRYFDSPVLEGAKAELDKSDKTIIVNHSASKSGNHLTILKKLRDIDTEKMIKEITVPLSYGKEIVRKQVSEYGEKHLNYCFKPLNDFLPKDQYFKSLNSKSAALFGHRRQEGGSNVFYLLAAGCKVFLRKDSNFLDYLRDRGIIVFEFENDLNTAEDLDQLNVEAQLNNREAILREFSQDEKDRVYSNLIN